MNNDRFGASYTVNRKRSRSGAAVGDFDPKDFFNSFGSSKKTLKATPKRKVAKRPQSSRISPLYTPNLKLRDERKSSKIAQTPITSKKRRSSKDLFNKNPNTILAEEKSRKSKKMVSNSVFDPEAYTKYLKNVKVANQKRANFINSKSSKPKMLRESEASKKFQKKKVGNALPKVKKSISNPSRKKARPSSARVTMKSDSIFENRKNVNLDEFINKKNRNNKLKKKKNGRTITDPKFNLEKKKKLKKRRDTMNGDFIPDMKQIESKNSTEDIITNQADIKCIDLTHKKEAAKEISSIFQNFYDQLKCQERKLMEKLQKPVQKQADKEVIEHKLYVDTDGTMNFIDKIGKREFLTYEQVLAKQQKMLDSLKKIQTKEEEIKEEQKKNEEREIEKEKSIQEIKAKKAQIEQSVNKTKRLTEKAKKNVQLIHRNDIDELRVMYRPPVIVKKVVACVLFICKQLKFEDHVKQKKKLDEEEEKKMVIEIWQKIRKHVTIKFIHELCGFDISSLDENAIDYIKTRWLDDPDFNYEFASNANRVTGPLVAWVQSQLGYAEALIMSNPIQREIQKLKDKIIAIEFEKENIHKANINKQKEIETQRRQANDLLGLAQFSDMYYDRI